MNPVLKRHLEASGLTISQVEALEREGVREAGDLQHLSRDQISTITQCNAVTAAKIARLGAETTPQKVFAPRAMKPHIIIVAVLVALAAIVAASYALQLGLWSNVLLGVGAAVAVIWYLFGIKRAIFWVIDTFEFAFVGALFSWPIVIFAICWWIPEFHQPFRIPPQDEVKNWMLVISFASFLLAFVSIEASYYLRRKWMIVGNLITSQSWAIVIGVFTGANGFQYWTLLPFIASLIEAIGGTFAGVQNAWNKNPAQIERDA
jgi:hypothetical protein